MRAILNVCEQTYPTRFVFSKQIPWKQFLFSICLNLWQM